MKARPVTHGGQRPAREEEVGARAHHPLEGEADAEHSREVDGHDRVVDRRELGDRIAFHREARGRECVGALRDAGASGAVVPESAGNMFAGRSGESAGARSAASRVGLTVARLMSGGLGAPLWPVPVPASSARAYTRRASRNCRESLATPRGSSSGNAHGLATARGHSTACRRGECTPPTLSDRPLPVGVRVLPTLTGSVLGRDGSASSVGGVRAASRLRGPTREGAGVRGGRSPEIGRPTGRPIKSLRPSGCPRPNAARAIRDRDTRASASSKTAPERRSIPRPFPHQRAPAHPAPIPPRACADTAPSPARTPHTR